LFDLAHLRLHIRSTLAVIDTLFESLAGKFRPYHDRHGKVTVIEY